MEKSFSEIEAEVRIILKNFLSESGARQDINLITLDAYFDRDLGMDSLGRVEFFHRVEKYYNIKLPTDLISEAGSLRDVIRAIQGASPQKPKQPDQFIQPLEYTQMVPSTANTLVDVLLNYSKNVPQRPHIYFQDESGSEQIITYGHLYEYALATAKGLHEMGLKHGETVAIMLPTSESFFYAFFGILLAGGVPVPIYPPFQLDRIEEYAIRESTILRNAEVKVLITFHKAGVLSRLLRVLIPSLKDVVTIDKLISLPGKNIKTRNQPEDVALIQYTSGSTSLPKGVTLTHQNLLANIRAYGKAINVNPTDVGVSWLPLYHDMGLIGAWLGSFYYGIPVTIMSPLSFLTRPERWLWSIHYHRATLTGGPNFAYELCIHKINEKDIAGLDLSSLRIAFNGAEAINPNTIRNFIRKFKPYGLKTEALFPVYGLAESTVALTFPVLGREPRIDKIKRTHLEKEQKAIPISMQDQNYLEFVGCGIPLEDHHIRIVDDNNQVLQERFIGNLQFRGPSTMQGYYNNKNATEATFYDGWCNTGDLAYIADNELFITGRKKDVIIKAGRNIFPEEIEEITSHVEGIRKGCVAAFGINDLVKGTEKLVIVAESHAQTKKEKQKIISEIIEKVATVSGNPPDEVLLMRSRTIMKTSSGKLRRSACKTEYLNGKLGQIKRPPWVQMTRLHVIAGWKKLKSYFGLFGRILYSSYVYFIALLLFIPLWLSIVLPPQHVARKISRQIVRLFLFLSGFPAKVVGKENIPDNKTAVYVANHASYLDTFVLVASLPTNTVLVAKKELQKAPIVGLFIEKLGHLSVERFEFTKSISDLKQIQKTLKNGTSIAMFPEGTFTYASGLRQFKLGAFKMATETGRPIYPVSIRGTRNIFRAGTPWFKPGKIIVTVSKPLLPQEKGWDENIRLRDLAKAEIAKHSGEEIISF